MSPSEFPITVTPGTITVEGIVAEMAENHIVLYVSLREKRAEAKVVCEGPGVVSIRATESTLRVNKDTDKYERIVLADEVPTHINLPCGWAYEASVVRYTCRILCVRKNPEATLVHLPITLQPE